MKGSLLTKYEPTNDLSFLTPPEVNKEILLNLGATVVTRDKHLTSNQAQVGASLNAFGSGFAELSKLECIQASAEGRTAVSMIVDGIHLLADHHFRLSQMRRAFIVPSLNFLGKTASDLTPIDDCLFGINLVEEINVAQSIERVARKMARKPAQLPTSQPARQLIQSLKQRSMLPLRERSERQENRKPPLRKFSAAQQTKRRPTQPGRNMRSSSRSRTRPRY